MSEPTFTVEALRVMYCMTFQQYIEVTGFNRAGGYAESKWHSFQDDMATALCNYDNGVLARLAKFANK